MGPLRWLMRTAIRQFHKRILRRDHRMQLPTGAWINLPIADRFASEAFITRADVDWGSERVLFSLLNGRGAFLDIGAHIGYYSLYMLPRATGVYSFEPDPRARAFLEANVFLHSLIEVIPSAVGAASGNAIFTLESDAELSHLSCSNEISFNQIEVEVITIDAFVAARGLTVEAIKIDIEGHDIEAIRGALNVLEQQQPIVLTEARPTPELFAITTRLGYRIFAFVRHAHTRKKCFAEISEDHPARGETKMVFLVPDRMSTEFKNLKDLPGPWSLSW